MPAAAQLMPTLSEELLARSANLLERDGYVRIPGFLHPACAEALAEHLQHELTWNLSTLMHSKRWDATPAEQETIGVDRLEAMATADMGDDFRHLHDVVRIDGDPAKRARRGLLIDRLADVWNSPAAIAVWSRLTGRHDIEGLVMNATRFRPGHFITRHNDGNVGNRAAAYTLSLSSDWRAEWGGLLSFVDSQGDIERAFTPLFNSLVMFLVPREHCVSAVASFAPSARLTVSGWLMSGSD